MRYLKIHQAYVLMETEFLLTSNINFLKNQLDAECGRKKNFNKKTIQPLKLHQQNKKFK